MSCIAEAVPVRATEPNDRTIPRTLHFIWVGDEGKRPDNCIDTWRRHHPDWTIKIWGNDSLIDEGWVNAKHMTEMSRRELNGVADMMRWEILYREGGIVVDADSVCVRKLDDELLDAEAFACWESEIARPGLIAAGYFGCRAGNPFVGQIILDIHAEESVVGDMAWKTVGPQRLTDSYRRYRYQALRIHPSHYFIPEHFSGIVYDGTGPVYAHQKWASTLGIYDSLHTERMGSAGARLAVHEPVTPEPDLVAVTPPAKGSARSGDKTADASGNPGIDSIGSRAHEGHDPFFVQQVTVGRELAGLSRLAVFKRICEGKRVLHVGCADWPITNPASSLHLALEPHCAALDGFDVQVEALAQLEPHVKGRLFSRFEEIPGPYDVVLVPEVVEHVADVAGFLRSLDALGASAYVITVPDAYQCFGRHFKYSTADEQFTEIVHPDHNAWYTPYTLVNVLRKYTPWTIQGVWFFNGISLLAIATRG